MSITVSVDNACDAAGVPDEADFQRWVSAALDGLRMQADVAIGIIDVIESARLNGEYRDKPYATNVLSFPSGFAEDSEIQLLGDLAICAEVVAREAREQHKPAEAHWAHLVIHGCLHLLGFDHEEEAAAQLMEAREIAILHTLGYANPYEESCTHGG